MVNMSYNLMEILSSIVKPMEYLRMFIYLLFNISSYSALWQLMATSTLNKKVTTKTKTLQKYSQIFYLKIFANFRANCP